MKEKIISAEKHTGDRMAGVSWRRCHFSCKQKDEVGGNPNIKEGPSRGRIPRTTRFLLVPRTLQKAITHTNKSTR